MPLVDDAEAQPQPLGVPRRLRHVPIQAIRPTLGKAEVVRKGTAGAIRQDVRDKIAAGIDVIGPECAVPLQTPLENLRAIAVAVRFSADWRDKEPSHRA